MKLLLIPIAVFFLVSCGGNPEKATGEVKSMLKNTTEKVTQETKKVTKKVTSEAQKVADNVALAFDEEKAKALFTEKTCATCHQIDTKTVGPAIKVISEAYKGKKGAIVNFLQGNGEVLVDKTLAAVMQANIDNITSKMDVADLELLEAYIYNAK